jgi:gamma-glutamylcyclotransferase (GGCT)/AIG2-like uncharacterized protein YtfP
MKKIRLYKLFVYGTLKTKSKNTHKINAKMWHIGQFPGIKLDENSIINGQIVEVTELDLEKLDRYEGVPIVYTRKEVIAKPIEGDSDGEKVWVYEWAGSTDGLRRIDSWDY